MPRRESDRALKSLEKRGGAIWAFKIGEGSLVRLTYAGRRDGGVLVRGEVNKDMYPGTLAGNLPRDELISLGWGTRLTREWVLRTDKDRAELLRIVEESIELLAPTLGGQPTDYRLVHRPAGEEDGGSALIGCVFAIVSSIVGAVLGAVIAVVGQSPLPLPDVTIFAACVGLVVGFFVFGSLAPIVFAMVPATRASAGELTMSLMALVPGLIALGTWLLVGIFGLEDPDQILGVAAVLIVGLILASFVLTGIRGIRALRSRPKDRRP